MILFGNGDGAFSPMTFTLRPGPIAIADVTGDGLLDVIAYDAHAVHVLVNQRNATNHLPVVPDYRVSSSAACVTLDAKASDSDQHALFVRWFDASGAEIGPAQAMPRTRKSPASRALSRSGGLQTMAAAVRRVGR